MAHNTHDLGDLVRLSAEFRDADLGGVIDPDVVRLSIRSPDGNVSHFTYEDDSLIVRSSAGNYQADIDADQPGDWFYRWFSEGSGQAAQERRFLVREALAVE